MKHTNHNITKLIAAAVVAMTLTFGCDDEQVDTPADDPERELAEQELEAERQAQEQNRQTREGLQNAARDLSLKHEQRGEGVAGASRRAEDLRPPPGREATSRP